MKVWNEWCGGNKLWFTVLFVQFSWFPWSSNSPDNCAMLIGCLRSFIIQLKTPLFSLLTNTTDATFSQLLWSRLYTDVFKLWQLFPNYTTFKETLEVNHSNLLWYSLFCCSGWIRRKQRATNIWVRFIVLAFNLTNKGWFRIQHKVLCKYSL